MEKPRDEDILIHACCGPCSLEPVRILRERGCEPHVYFANSNIAPRSEYERRLEVIAAFAKDEGIELFEGDYDPAAWEETAGRVGEELRAHEEPDTRARCRACYRMRFEEAAAFAREHGFAALGTTLSVSPYQHQDVIEEELERACAKAGIACAFEDYSPHYRAATERSRALGMYRQNYCGCRFSDEEAEAERAERRALREAEKAARRAERALQEREQEARRAERAAYDAKQARKRAVLKGMRAARKEHEDA